MRKIILAGISSVALFINCTESESPCENENLEITDLNGNVIDCIEIPESPSF